MKRLLSLVIMSLMLTSCYIEGFGSHLEIIKQEYELPNSFWDGQLWYKIYSKNDFIEKGIQFSEDGTECTVYTSISFVTPFTFDEEKLIVRSDGPNRLILTEEGRYRAIYEIYFSKERKDSFEMTWKNHTRLEKKHIPEKSLSVKMKRVVIYFEPF